MLSDYNIIWDSPSEDCAGVMPVGNGDIAAGVYALRGGGLYLLLAKNDAWNYKGDLYKTGRVKLTITPDPFAGGKFTQTLDIEHGCINIETDTVRIKIWADANSNALHVGVDSDGPVSLSAAPEFWERIDGTKDVCLADGNSVLWYFDVGERSSFHDELEQFSLGELAERYRDPYRYNIFGNMLQCDGCAVAGRELSGAGSHFDVRVYGLCEKSPDAADWARDIRRLASDDRERKDAWQAHLDWWAAWWRRSYIYITDNEISPDKRRVPNIEKTADGRLEAADNGALAAQGYMMFRFLTACQCRGPKQMKFNGGLFTQQFFTRANAERRVDPYMQPDGRMLLHEDDRLWGSRYTFQNQRLMYWPMLAGGDWDMLMPFFRYYSDLLPIRKELTRRWFGHAGAYFRENVQPTGMDLPEEGHVWPPKTRRGEQYEGWYHDYYFTSSLELVAMMIEYLRYTGDAGFGEQILAPMAREVLLFFDKHYERDENGKLVLDPAQVLETFWIAVNPAPDVAGLRYVLSALPRLGVGTEEDRQNWDRLMSELPDVPMREFDGKRAIAPAERFEKKSNFENGELYPVFPFTQFGVGYGTEQIVYNTMLHRTWPEAPVGNEGGCWSQDQIQWAYAGRAEEARDGLIRRFSIASPDHRFPFYGRENPDSCPDFDHAGSGSVALQRMLVQEAGGHIYLLPAWPRNWDADFKLRVHGGGSIEGAVRGGKLQSWDAAPAELRQKVVVYGDWAAGKE